MDSGEIIISILLAVFTGVMGMIGFIAKNTIKFIQDQSNMIWAEIDKIHDVLRCIQTELVKVAGAFEAHSKISDNEIKYLRQKVFENTGNINCLKTWTESYDSRITRVEQIDCHKEKLK